MPTIPGYNQWATEEAGLTRAKRRVLKNMKSGIAELTEKPDTDLTNGSADVLGTRLIAQFEDLTALFRQINAYFGSGIGEVTLTESGDIVKAMTVVILSAKAVGRIVRTVNQLYPKMRYMDLGILSDLQAVQQECFEVSQESFSILKQVDFDGVINDTDVPPGVMEELADDPMDGSEPSYGSDYEPEDFEEYSIQSETSYRGRPVVQGSKTDLLRQANQALQDLQQVELDRREREESRRLLFEQLELDRQRNVPKDEMAEDIITQDKPMKVKLFKRIDKKTYLTLLNNIEKALKDAMDKLNLGYRQFNKYRQQRVLPAKADVADVSNAIRTGAGVYRIGGSSDIYQKIDRFV